MSQVLTNYREQLENAKMPAGKKKVLQTALTLFANNGFHATTTAKIAKQAGVSEGTIYKYFNSKDDLLAKLLQPILLEIKDNFFSDIDYSADLTELIHFIVTDRIHFIDTNFDFIRLLMQEILTNKLANQYYTEFFNGNKGTLHQIAELRAAYPEINQSLTPVQILRSIIGPVIIYIFQTKLFQIPAADNDLSIIERQIINNLTKK
ncbi:TetR/AcrR family transcriptional regulator [Limosilactobacillus sp. STM2_1]|uniref:TetR/AcrR family transcriptional regulator n=1 Tax=Limosilactobacillus rudii TaxID=2759755 RepID=A0A7W3UJC1_9LACO|nr:TetR/AcrR family transcriptional regulator [Limosilactobacillus rudii]MBB1078508.1 TetR/AcrR family transcriptional regulator [Limosilactobacillus rudii]MBB1096638.1 TetR/AcrR family transcriptional regulator [Limosilactobacillus rudii]MCD7134166.1 TetR/AcrR family transcriptional regulator [Limosilactobacillus rudii]